MREILFKAKRKNWCERCGNVLEIAEMEDEGIWEDN